jgi:hypothetical protein
MPLYKMSQLAPLAIAEINAIIRLASDKEKLAKPSADRGSITVKGKRARRAMQMELQLQQSIRRS